MMYRNFYRTRNAYLTELMNASEALQSTASQICQEREVVDRKFPYCGEQEIANSLLSTYDQVRKMGSEAEQKLGGMILGAAEIFSPFLDSDDRPLLEKVRKAALKDDVDLQKISKIVEKMGNLPARQTAYFALDSAVWPMILEASREKGVGSKEMQDKFALFSSPAMKNIAAMALQDRIFKDISIPKDLTTMHLNRSLSAHVFSANSVFYSALRLGIDHEVFAAAGYMMTAYGVSHDSRIIKRLVESASSPNMAKTIRDILRKKAEREERESRANEERAQSSRGGHAHSEEHYGGRQNTKPEYEVEIDEIMGDLQRKGWTIKKIRYHLLFQYHPDRHHYEGGEATSHFTRVAQYINKKTSSNQ